MYRPQPDPRIRVSELGVLSLNGNRYATHDKVGCPRNAVIEIHQGILRCWSCRQPLNDQAADYLKENAIPRENPQGNKDGDPMVWKDGFYHHKGRR